MSQLKARPLVLEHGDLRHHCCGHLGLSHMMSKARWLHMSSTYNLDLLKLVSNNDRQTDDCTK